ncbi:MAG: DUF1152 domain-containing protein [Pirellulales bacterium]|nr:DUF1152 domain-containing protein [Pirellulales bacterium]
MSSVDSSLCLPTFLRRLADPGIKTVLLCGCGGGFDFVHGLLLYPELRRLGKCVVIGSYSFGRPERIGGETQVIFKRSGVVAKRVTAASVPPADYGPEVHVCSFLDRKFPADAPHWVYAYYAREFTVPLLRQLYQQFIREHTVDAVILVDGGSDSLMAGDEEGLGDPIEDAVSVTTVASLEGLQRKLLIIVGLGADRFNHVSDVASLRAVAELTGMGGFLGAVGIEPTCPGYGFYRECLEHIEHAHGVHGFRSVISGAIRSSVEGSFGRESVPPALKERVSKGGIFLWPLMAMLWAFDIDTVARRSRIAKWICECQTVAECYAALEDGRCLLGSLREVEDFPRHEEMRW